MFNCNERIMGNSKPYRLCEEKIMYKDEERLELHPREYWEHLIEQWVLDEQARKAITMNFLDGKSYELIAEELDVSRATIYNKIAKYSPKLFKHSD